MKLFKNITRVSTAATDSVVDTLENLSKGTKYIANELDLALAKQELDHQMELAILAKVAASDIPDDRIQAIADAKLADMLDSLS